MTPFEAREPYKIVAEASFSKVMLSIRLISISKTFCDVTSKPSKIKIGAVEPFWKDPLPRIVKSGNLLGLDPSRLFSSILKPASSVEIVVKIFPVDTFASSCLDITVVVPAKPLFLRFSKPVTTTSSISWLSLSKVTSTTVLLPTTTDFGFIPI